jgi:hypothetical protein
MYPINIQIELLHFKLYIYNYKLENILPDLM